MRRGRGEGTISRRKSDGRWVAIVGHGYNDAGKRIRQSVYGRTREEVVAKLAPALRARDDGLPVTPARLTVGSQLGGWLEAVRPTVRPATFTSYEYIVRIHLAPTLGATRLVKLTPADVERMMGTKNAAGLSPRTIALMRTVLRMALGRAVKHGLLARNVAALASAPRQERHEINPLSPDECRTLVAAVAGSRLEGPVVVAVSTGLRAGELLGLQWEDVDLVGGNLTVRNALQRINGEHRLVPPKTSSSRRTVALGAGTIAAIRAHRVRQLEERLAAGDEWNAKWPELVFQSMVGGPVDVNNLRHQFHRVLDQAGLRRVRWHDLRHAAASLLLAQNVHPRVIMGLLGHSSIAVTMNTYAHVLPAAQRDAAETMDALLAAR